MADQTSPRHSRKMSLVTDPPNITQAPKVPPVIPEKKTLSKAERREIQERQRAAKAAAKPPTSAPSSKQPAATSSAAQPQPKAQQPKAKQSKAEEHPTSTTKAGKDSHDAVIKSAAPEVFSLPDGLRLFSHFGVPKPIGSLEVGIKGEIHPAVRKLGLQFADFRIVGANARCISTLTAFKMVIQDYVTPQGTTLSRHLMTYLSPQISYLVAARPMSVSTGNAIRYLKYEISILSIDLPEQDAKEFLCERIDTFIRERILFADQVIQELAIDKIHEGDVILTFARSSVVEKTLLGAKEEGRTFSVVVIDSRPLSEGKRLLNALVSASIPTTYALLSSLPSILPTVSTVMLGTHALHSNGSLYSRAGTALVAMMAKQHSVPVLVCCETYKFSDGILLDSFMKNELAPVSVSKPPLGTPAPHLSILSPLYDLTPPTNITAVVTEIGMIPATAVPMVLSRTTQGTV